MVNFIRFRYELLWMLVSRSDCFGALELITSCRDITHPLGTSLSFCFKTVLLDLNRKNSTSLAKSLIRVLTHRKASPLSVYVLHDEHQPEAFPNVSCGPGGAGK
jgi:hypothetical protein